MCMGIKTNQRTNRYRCSWIIGGTTDKHSDSIIARKLKGRQLATGGTRISKNLAPTLQETLIWNQSGGEKRGNTLRPRQTLSTEVSLKVFCSDNMFVCLCVCACSLKMFCSDKICSCVCNWHRSWSK